MKIVKKSTISPSMIAVKKSLGTLQKVLALIEDEKQYGSVIQQIDAAIGLAHAAKKSLMSEYLERVVKENKNQKKLIADLQKLYTYTVK
ncbi:MAG: metal-sensing transcriptional repressor [Patescibacteria group bacterium]